MDNLLGGSQDDKLFGNAGADNLSGGSHKDLLVGGPDADDVNGGPGLDTCQGDPADTSTASCETVTGARGEARTRVTNARREV